ncbi:hypothetical protein LTR15_002956 [Elasticomyces elasticus]|nr:hypothetical protein LTR15_002956 [Elasticomyces elasticus]
MQGPGGAASSQASTLGAVYSTIASPTSQKTFAVPPPHQDRANVPILVMDTASSSRAARLAKLFDSYVKGKRAPKTANDGKLLLEAICGRDDATDCVQQLAGSSNALDALRISLRFNTTPAFINDSFKDLVVYLQDPIVKQLCNGMLYQQLLSIIVQPPTLWNAVVQAHQSKRLCPQADLAFANLLLDLLSCPDHPPIDVFDTARDVTATQTLLTSHDHDVRAVGYRIQHILQALSSNFESSPSGPGGRHDNDFADYRKIAIFPTEDELLCKDKPFLRRADAVYDTAVDSRTGIHLDNQFRLLKEDFLAELRDDLGLAQGKKKSRWTRTRLRGLALAGSYCGKVRVRHPFALALTFTDGAAQFVRLQEQGRKKYLKDNPKFLKHQSFGVLMDGEKVVAFATLSRIEDLLLRKSPIITVQVSSEAALAKALTALKSSDTVDFVLVDTSVFAYEPVLRCLQSKMGLPLAGELLGTGPISSVPFSPVSPMELVYSIEDNGGEDLDHILGLSKEVSLDESQLLSLLAGLRQCVSLIQGPPGTGKSFIGALLAKALHDRTKEKILVICYTNHALDQFLEDLLDIGIDQSRMVRLGAKSTPRTKPFSLFELTRSTKISQEIWRVVDGLDAEVEAQQAVVDARVSELVNFQPTPGKVMDHLEFSEHDSDFFDALRLPELDPEETVVGKGGKKIGLHYLFDQWTNGQDAGVFKQSVEPEHAYIWQLDKDSRHRRLQAWLRNMLQEYVSGVSAAAAEFSKLEAAFRDAREQKDGQVINQRRIIACTTTAAAKYTRQLQSAAPGIILVEEAGEILESHVLTAITSCTKQLILIGDHQQLRPKVNNHQLTVERGMGYDLNRSLFERLIKAGFPHTTLTQQHRMCPEISSLVRDLAYPKLVDAQSTTQRPPLRGIRDRVIFIDHRHSELMSDIADNRDEGVSLSKQNVFEASMVLKIVRYLAQQGYGTKDQVVLTPYLGQLRLLRDELAHENDPVLNDLDSFDLIRAGVMSGASAAASQNPIRLSTIDNYQGEESEIVIVSLTRSNTDGEIGFMASPERLNVLLSRARSALILIGDSETFVASRKGTVIWKPLIEKLALRNAVFEGLPVHCEQHINTEMLLKSPEDFDEQCPEDGCSTLCGAKLACGLHECSRKCHKLADHAKIKCGHILEDRCPKNHKISWVCSALRPASCHTCDVEARIAAQRQQRDLALEQKRQDLQAAYALKLAEIQVEIDDTRQSVRDRREAHERDNILQQRRMDLETARAQAAQQMQPNMPNGTSNATSQKAAAVSNDTAPRERSTASKKSPTSQDPVNGSGLQSPVSKARADWEYQKKMEGASNTSLDTLMAMIGLENVKDHLLEIKARVDLSVRQGTDLKKDRYGTAFLGNPGTGKTTVARLYAKFLFSMGVLPGEHFVETTGSKLANDGVQGCTKMLDDMLKQGGGAMFIDEAYQLTSGSSSGGKSVLDFLLAEVENLTGKVVFILAGYNKQMESFFAHNPGIPSRFPHQIQFADYEDSELLAILSYGVEKKYEGRMKLEDGAGGLYARILARRIGRGRGKPGFGNARAVENAMAIVYSRQAKSLHVERRAGKKPDDFLLTKIDIIGPEPTDILSSNATWKKLQGLVGLKSVKESVQALFNSISFNYQQELAEQPLVDFSLNKVFLGSPGTGKTSVATLYGQILADIGMLSNGEVIMKTPADFIGSVLGGSEANTKGILDAAKGKVLVLDEAYGLYAGGGTSDPYRTAVIDTIVAEVQNVPGDDRCVLLLGYKEQMEEMMQNVNPGLRRRFSTDSGFVFEDFDDAQMAVIFDNKLKATGFKVTPKGRDVALEMLKRARNRPNFGNAGEIDNLMNDTKARQQKRISHEGYSAAMVLEAHDFDPDHERGERAITNIAMLFKDVVGCDGIVAQLQGYQEVAANMKACGMDPKEQLPFCFLFRGPPGTGKTSTARRMGKVYYDMGFLAKAEVVECSAKDLIGEYVGQTGSKTQKKVESALGKVLFVDEAYRLGDGPFAKEAIDELVDCVTKPQFYQKVVIILAGYENDINKLMDVNPGLSSRFPETVDFRSMTTEESFVLLGQLFAKKKQIDSTVLTSPTDDFRHQMLVSLERLCALSNFASARDIQTLAKRILGKVMKTKPTKDSMVLQENLMLEEIDAIVVERSQRAKAAGVLPSVDSLPPMLARPRDKQAPNIKPATATVQQIETEQELEQHAGAQEAGPELQEKPDEDGDDAHRGGRVAIRDAGVSDAVWNQLQEDRRKEEEEKREAVRLEQEEARLKKWLKDCADAKRQRELEEIVRKRKALEEKLKQEAQMKEKLMQMGRCPVGYQWIKQGGGWRCAGGSHYMSEGEAQALCQ